MIFFWSQKLWFDGNHIVNLRVHTPPPSEHHPQSLPIFFQGHPLWRLVLCPFLKKFLENFEFLETSEV